MKNIIFLLSIAIFLSACAKEKIATQPKPQLDTAITQKSDIEKKEAPKPKEEAKVDTLAGLKSLTPEDITPDMIAKAQSTINDAYSEKGVLAKMIHFDFDSYEIRNDAKLILQELANYLKEYRALKIIVEGHCDERGTREYNLALGLRRAEAAKKYLVDLGVDETRLDIVSYGKDKPLDSSHTEEAWSKNRRAQFSRAQ